LLIVDIVRPGTLVSAFSVFYSGASTRVKSKARAFAINVVVGLLQLATFVIIVGWIWSILWGMTFVQLAGTASLLPRYARNAIPAPCTLLSRVCLSVRLSQAGTVSKRLDESNRFLAWGLPIPPIPHRALRKCGYLLKLRYMSL